MPNSLFGLICLAILASNIVTMSRWSEARGVYDDICYLRQAHLFQRLGIGGLNTNAALDYDHYFEGKLKEIAFAEWQRPDPLALPQSDAERQDRDAISAGHRISAGAVSRRATRWCRSTLPRA